MAEQSWKLFVDESGDFGDECANVVAAGILVRGLRSDPRAIREHLERMAPGLPWPLHASRLNQPVWLAAVLGTRPDALRRDGMEFREERRSLLASAWQRLRSLHPTDAAELERELVASVERARVVQLARAMESSLSHVEAAAAHAMSRELRAGIARVFQAVSAEAIHVLFAGESETGQQVQGDRYLALLPFLTRRAARIVARDGVPAVIRLHILDRKVTDPELGRRELLHLRHLREAVAAGRAGAVRTAPERLWKFRVDEHGDFDPMLVFADFAANRGRVPCGGGATLAITEEHLHRSLQRSPRSGHPPRSHLAASGLAARIEEGRSTDVASQRARLWAIEQAAEWRVQR